MVAGDSACQIFHHASPIPGSRIHRLASAVGQRIRISQRSDAEGFVLHARAAAHTGTQVLVHMWDSPERPCEAKLRLSDSVPSGARPPRRQGQCELVLGEGNKAGGRLPGDGGSVDEDSMMED